MDKSETIREWIRGLFSENFDFSNRDLVKEKFKEHFESEENKQLEISWANQNTLYIKSLKYVCKEKKIDVRTFGYAREKIKFVESSSDAQADVKITPKPKGSTTATIETKTSTGTETTEKPVTYTPITEEHAVKLTKICWRVCGSVLHAWKEKFEKFDNDELEELAIAWEPLIHPYLEKYGGKIIIALMVTAGVFSKRAHVFKKKKSDKDEDEEETEELSEKDKQDFKKWQEAQNKK